MIATLFYATNISAQDWPAFRGADGTGATNPGGVLSKSSQVALKVRWKRTLGSGYSSVVTSGDILVTMYSDGTDDYVVCLNKSNGETVWQTKVAPNYKGENGSFDGPITTPLIHESHVYALDPCGEFVCLSLKDGSQVWSVHLVDDLGSVKPLYGFATSPIAAGGNVILQTGVKDKSLAGFDPKTGDVKWSVSDDVINSQTPTLMKFRGKPIVLAAGGKNLVGVDPESGDVLFEYAHGAGNGQSMVPVVLPENRVLLTLADTHSKTVSLRPADGKKINASEDWTNRSIKNTYNVPAIANGRLFAFSTRILTGVDMANGNPLWKSREPGDGFLITVDDHLIIVTKKGSLHVGVGSDEGYAEKASIPLFDDLCWSLPTYDDNAIYLRSLGEVACVELKAGEAIVSTDNHSGSTLGPQLSKAIASIEAASTDEEKVKRVDEFIGSVKSFPLIEGDLVQFLYRGKGTDVAVASDIYGARQERKMNRVAGTDLFYNSARLPRDQRANYVFLVDYQPMLDSRNDRAVTSSVYAGEMEFAVRLRGSDPLKMSWFGMPEWKAPSYMKGGSSDLNGKLVEHEVESELIDGGFKATVYLPPQYASEKERTFPVIYVFAAGGVQDKGMLNRSADRVFSETNSKTNPSILVYAALPPSPQGNEALVKELLPSIEKNFRTVAGRDGRSTVGFGFAAGAAIGLAARHNDLFFGTAVYSPLMFDAERKMVAGELEKLERSLKIYIEWGRFDMFNPHENWDIRKEGQEVYDLCKSNEHVQLSGGMVNDSTDWSSWRNRYLKFLQLGQ